MSTNVGNAARTVRLNAHVSLAGKTGYGIKRSGGEWVIAAADDAEAVCASPNLADLPTVGVIEGDALILTSEAAVAGDTMTTDANGAFELSNAAGDKAFAYMLEDAATTGKLYRAYVNFLGPLVHL